MEGEPVAGTTRGSPKIDDSDSYIIGIGASAGGLDVIKSFFDNVPAGCPHSFVLIQHLSPDHKSLMADLLQRNTQLPIHEAEDGIEVERGVIYLIPPKKNLELREGRLSLSDKPARNSLNLPIDIFFRSLARSQGDRAIGIILTGTGSDGTRGVRSIKEAGGMVMVQDPNEATFDGMPLSAINTGLVDFILPAAQLPVELQSFIDHPIGNGSIDHSAATDSELLGQVMERVRTIANLDFSDYKRPTLARRVERRMGIKKCNSIDQYLTLIDAEPREAQILARECLIGVTKFFRDTSAWDSLATNVLPDLIRQKSEDMETLRVWSAACSTGEEVYTIAILLEEEMERQGKHCEVKIFATDLSAQHLAIASKGQYPESIIADVRSDRLNKHFIRRLDEYQTRESLRSMAIFSPHNVLKDPPFKDIDLVVCRNMLIYLQPEAQQKALASLHYALRRNGTLMLGPTESIGEFGAALRKVDARANLFTNETPSRGFGFDSLRYADLKPGRGAQARTRGHLPIGTRSAEVLGEALTDELGLAAVFVDESFEIMHAAGEIRSFAGLPQHGFSSNLLKLLDNNLSAAVTTAVRRAKLQTTDVHYRGVRVVRDGKLVKLNIVVRPFSLEGPDWPQCYAVIFIPQDVESGELPELSSEFQNGAVADRVIQAEQELKDTRESLQAAIEELETTNEELQATNEELIAANEELQSTNEELQSMNEELHTVNAEHQLKISDLAELNADMDNLLQSTEIGTIFLDAGMRIRKYTPRVQEQFNLRSVDIGRPLSHFSSTFTNNDNDRLLADALTVLETGQMLDIEVGISSGETELVKLAPFHNRAGDIDGVVMSFVDVTELKRVQMDYANQKDMFEQVLEGAMAGYWEYRPSDGVFHMSPSSKALLGYGDHEVSNDLETFKGLVHSDDVDKVEQDFLVHQASNAKPPHEMELRFIHRDGSTIWLWCRGKEVAWGEAGNPDRIIGCFVDITDLKQVQSELERSNDELKQFAYLTSHDLQEPLRTVSNFVEILEKRYSDVIDTDGRQYLDIVSQATGRMQGLIRGILDYSRIGRDGIKVVVDTESVVTDVISDFDAVISEAEADIEIKGLPKVLGYESELRTLFSNLISNAIKFREPGRAPKIEISAEQLQPHGWRFSVADNGIGIAPRYQDRIFEIFNRLHTREQYEGAGIGLAHCRKIVELHHGTMSVESKAGIGATFRFSLLLE